MKAIRGGEVIARMLVKEGVDKVFGIIDGSYFGFYSSLKKVGIELIGPRNEASAAHMAGAYARLTGKLGVCMASNGPGVANILPGVAVENGEGNRVLLITSCRRDGIVYPDRGGTYQYFSQANVTKAMTKWSGAVPSFARVPEFIRRAMRIAHTGRPGVVHVDVPESILNGKFKFDESSLSEPSRYRLTERIEPSAAQVERAAQMLVKAKLPMIHAGSGVLHAGAFEALRQVAELLQAPVTTSWAGRGVLPETNPCAIPMIHIELTNEVRNRADLVLTLGSRIGETDWWGKAPYWASPAVQGHIQVDIDPEVIGVNKPVDLAVLGDAKLFLERLHARLLELKGGIDLAPRQSALARYGAKAAANRAALDKPLQNVKSPLHSGHVGKVCQEIFPDDTVWVFDGGNTAVWANFYHQARTPNCILSTFKFGMLGAGVGQALGAKVARPKSPVCCIIGDGAMGMQPQEIETAIRTGLSVVYVVLCDRQWGMVKMNQQFMLKPLKTIIKKSLGPDETINADFEEIRFDLLAQSMGAHGERVGTPADLRAALQRCLALDRPAVIHVDVDPVVHMWAPGLRTFKAMHAEPAGA